MGGRKLTSTAGMASGCGSERAAAHGHHPGEPRHRGGALAQFELHRNRPGQGRDPLGRRNREATGGQDNASDTRVPDEAELLKTRRIQEELRRRGAERERPAQELEYIDRLLRRF